MGRVKRDVISCFNECEMVERSKDMKLMKPGS